MFLLVSNNILLRIVDIQILNCIEHFLFLGLIPYFQLSKTTRSYVLSFSQLKKKNGPPGTVRVKISGDGTRMSHSSSLFVCTFSILEDDAQNCLSSAGMCFFFNKLLCPPHSPALSTKTHTNFSYFLISLAGNHTIAIVKEKEDHAALKSSLANVIRDVNSTIKEGHVTVDGQQVRLEFYLGGDYKVRICFQGVNQWKHMMWIP